MKDLSNTQFIATLRAAAILAVLLFVAMLVLTGCATSASTNVRTSTISYHGDCTYDLSIKNSRCYIA